MTGLNRPRFEAHFTPHRVGWRLPRAMWGQGLCQRGGQAPSIAFGTLGEKRILAFTTV